MTNDAQQIWRKQVAEHHGSMAEYRVPVIVTYDIDADASYIYLTEERRPANRRKPGKWGGLSPEGRPAGHRDRPPGRAEFHRHPR
jgi:hypothetical protein